MLFYLICLFLFALYAGLLFGLVQYSAPAVRLSHPGNITAPDFAGNEPPPATMIVPLTGDTPEMEPAIASLCGQGYPDLEVIFTLEDMDDPAVGLLNRVVPKDANTRIVSAGPALCCGQKNHNLLAAVAAARPESTLLLFCDSTHVARPDFASHLAAPIIRKEARLSSGFHRVVPGNYSLGVLGMLICNLFIQLLHPIRQLVQPWGGATAIEREVFDKYDAASVWSTNILDDFPLGLHLQRFGIKTYPVFRACLKTHIDHCPVSKWQIWWQRQLHYMKFCLPIPWAAFTLVIVFLLGTPLLAVVSLGMGLAGAAPTGLALGALAYLLVMPLVILNFRKAVPFHIPAAAWLKAFLASVTMTALCYAKTVPTNIISWRHISYRVGWGGKVREIITHK